MKKLLLLAITAFFALTISAQEYYVSKTTGSTRGDGSKEKPYKTIQKAIDAVPEGSTIYVAEGNYFGTLDCGNINVTKCVKIYGGYNTDFTTRDILKYRTLVQPTAESNGTAKGGGTMIIKVYNPNGEIVIDGLLFDRGNSIAYNAKGEGKPKGVESPMMNPIGSAGIGGPNLELTGVLTTETRELYFDNPNCKTITIRNCAFVNAPNYGIGGMFQGEVTIDNCIFVNCRMIACDVMGSNGQNYQTVHFTNNTVLFTWSRMKDFDDMGYGFRYNNGTHSYVDHCIIGCSIYAGLDRCRLDYKDKEAQKIAETTNNMFFLNRRADAALAGGGKFIMINVDQFEDAEPLTEIDGCIGMSDPKVFNGKINEAYLKGFANATYKESVDYQPSSADNKLRAALGLNKQGSISSSSSMFANRYPFEDALKLFGAVQGYGAQLPK